MGQQHRGAVAGLRRKLVVVGAVAVMGVAGNAAVAEAAATPADPVPGKSSVDFSTHSKAQSARVIHCEIRFIGAHGGIPHKSGHVHGTINVRTGVTCSQPIRMIRGKVGLFSNRGSKIKAFGSTGARTAKGNAALVCRTGRYHGEAVATLYAPPGYSPRVVTVGKKTPTVSIHC
ncbi:hypothetical protein HUT06_42850 [Actinomadura sp. NAK00032]|uniref:hypothetical protein n=1 Tax=Actinomadura sp. NAK00032 TaxID=2742128 RepID=UPI0015901F38|nr:hypothetical protein [Actinomadura sp. NAK00032]QKW39948.1 hypothetical protein HUT06_42850 [Actinomadura sp. NAK00032]